MKKEHIFPVALIFTQEEMSLLLNAKRSQWVMYLHGQRDLPLESKLKLASLIASVCELPQDESSENQELTLFWDGLLKENRFRQLKIQKRLNRVVARYKAAQNTLCLITDLEIKNEFFNAHQAMFSVVQKRANRIIQKNSLEVQEFLKVKWVVLKIEEKYLQSKKENQG